MAVCTDREGAAFCLWQANQHRGAAVVNEPGSLNFNDLNTRDVEGAKVQLQRATRLGPPLAREADRLLNRLEVVQER